MFMSKGLIRLQKGYRMSKALSVKTQNLIWSTDRDLGNWSDAEAHAREELLLEIQEMTIQEVMEIVLSYKQETAMEDTITERAEEELQNLRLEIKDEVTDKLDTMVGELQENIENTKENIGDILSGDL